MAAGRGLGHRRLVLERSSWFRWGLWWFPGVGSWGYVWWLQGLGARGSGLGAPVSGGCSPARQALGACAGARFPVARCAGGGGLRLACYFVFSRLPFDRSVFAARAISCQDI